MLMATFSGLDVDVVKDKEEMVIAGERGRKGDFDLVIELRSLGMKGDAGDVFVGHLVLALDVKDVETGSIEIEIVFKHADLNGDVSRGRSSRPVAQIDVFDVQIEIVDKGEVWCDSGLGGKLLHLHDRHCCRLLALICWPQLEKRGVETVSWDVIKGEIFHSQRQGGGNRLQSLDRSCLGELCEGLKDGFVVELCGFDLEDGFDRGHFDHLEIFTKERDCSPCKGLCEGNPSHRVFCHVLNFLKVLCFDLQAFCFVLFFQPNVRPLKRNDDLMT